MKFRYAILALICIIIVAAWVTKPTAQAFNKYYQSQPSNIDAAPLINTIDKFLYTVNKVTVYTQLTIAAEHKQVATPQLKETYIGLFGKFWKID